MEYEEKKVQEKSTSDITHEYYDETLHEPRKEESLHRGLKARQISMIAVCFLNSISGIVVTIV
jgi:amino acid transporter